MPVMDDQRHVRTTPAARLFTLLVVLCALLAPASTAQAATPPAGFAGLGNWSIPSTAQAQVMGQIGMRTWRAGLVWNWVEPNPGTRNWHYVDQVVRGGATNGYDILLALNGCTQWACGATRTAPAQEPALSAYRGFVAAAVARYGRGGTFWTSNPQLVYRPVSWQVWNEVNAGQDWPNPSAPAYAAFLQAISATIKSVDPSALVVTSGLTEYPAISSGATLTSFLSQLYAQPGFRESFDVLAVHGYAESPAGVVRILDTTRRLTAQNGDGNRRIWVTEMGWSSGGPAHPFTVDEGTQAAYFQQTYDTLLGCRARWNLDRTYWFSLSDIPAAVMGEPDYWGFYTGLWRADGGHKPVFGAFAEYTGERPLPGGRGDTCALPGGTALDTTAIDTIITSSPRVINGSANPQVTFTASREARFECSLDSAPWTPCRSPVNVKTTREGGHELAVRAIDSGGVPDPTPARASWILDLTPPDTQFTQRPPSTAPKTNNVRLRFTGTDATGIEGYQCRQRQTVTRTVKRAVKKKTGKKASSAKAKKPVKKQTRRITVTVSSSWKPCKSGSLQQLTGRGLKRMQVRAVDRAGNVDPVPAQAGVTVNLACLRDAAKKVKSKTKKQASCAASTKKPTKKKTTRKR